MSEDKVKIPYTEQNRPTGLMELASDVLLLSYGHDVGVVVCFPVPDPESMSPGINRLKIIQATILVSEYSRSTTIKARRELIQSRLICANIDAHEEALKIKSFHKEVSVDNE